MSGKLKPGCLVRFTGNAEALLRGLPDEELDYLRPRFQANVFIFSGVDESRPGTAEIELRIGDNKAHFFCVPQAELDPM